jgi:hypothetical protein
MLRVAGITLALIAAFVILGSPSRAIAFMVPAGIAGLDSLTPFWRARVVCEQRKEGTKIRTFFCPDGNTCVSAGSEWKCRPPAAAPMSCAACARNQKRDSDACTTSGNLIAQNQCVNRVNAEYLKCIPGCSSP